MNTWGFVNSVAPCFLPRREGLHWEASCREELRRGSALPGSQLGNSPGNRRESRRESHRENRGKELRRGSALPWSAAPGSVAPGSAAGAFSCAVFSDGERRPRRGCLLPRPARTPPSRATKTALFRAANITPPGAAKLRPGAAKIRPAQRKSPVRRATKARPAHNEKLRQARNKKRPLPPRDKRPFCAKPRPGAQFSCGRGGAS